MAWATVLGRTGGSENLSSSLVLNASAPLFKHLKVDEPAGAFLSLAVAAGFVGLVFRAHAKLVTECVTKTTGSKPVPPASVGQTVLLKTKTVHPFSLLGQNPSRRLPWF